MTCEYCEKEIKKGDEYYDTGYVIACENCINEHLEYLKEDWYKYLPTQEEM
mgnify:CR=1 FL=1